MPGRQLPVRGVTRMPSVARKMLAELVSDTKPSTSSITASAAPATLAWTLACVTRQSGVPDGERKKKNHMGQIIDVHIPGKIDS